MDELITINEVKEILKVDRITVYRMLKDGRIKGVKVGRQWRVPSSEVKEIIAGDGIAETSPTLHPSEILPVHCLQAIQDVFAEVADVASLTAQTNGHPLTNISNSCKFCNLIIDSPKGKAACIESWRKIAQSPKTEPEFMKCHAGLDYARARIEQVGELVGVQIVGQVYFEEPDADEEVQRISELAERYGIDKQELLAKKGTIRRQALGQKIRISQWLNRIAETFEIIALERADLIGRLENIASLSSFHN